MNHFSNSLPIPNHTITVLLVDLKGSKNTDETLTPLIEHHPDCRAFRLVGDTQRFLYVALSKRSAQESIRLWLQNKVANGIDYRSKKFSFLGYTEGSLRNRRLIFFREDDIWSTDRLIDTFGDLKQVYYDHSYGKYAARLGLSFSSTAETLDVLPDECFSLPDELADDGTLTTDGCGMIRESFAQTLCKRLSIDQQTSAFQIRLGGIKGMLVRYPDTFFDSVCGINKKIAVRPSMIKYKEGPSKLEVLAISGHPRHARLSRQQIYLLLSLGVSIQNLEELLKEYLSDLGQIFMNREKALAMVIGEEDADPGNLIDQECFEMLRAGFDLTEPQLVRLLKRFFQRCVNSLKEKMGIPVNKSMMLFGATDETSNLREGQVFINVPIRGGVQTGFFMVSRNPSYSPEDICLFEAVNVPNLSHVQNVIVFPNYGRYSAPFRMSQGDLDGDKYYISNDPRLLPPRQNIRPPAPLQSIDPTKIKIEHGSEAMAKEAVNTFVDLGCNSILGQLSNKWTEEAGKTPDIADSAACRRLAPLIGRALNIVKSGDSIDALKTEARNIEHTTSAYTKGWEDPIAQLQLLIARYDPIADLHLSMTPFQSDPHLILQDMADPTEWSNAIEDAENVLPKFNRGLAKAISMDKFATESSIKESSRGGRESYANSLRQDYVKTYFGDFENGNFLDGSRVQLIRASAFYLIGYSRGKEAFAWLGCRQLCYIKACRLNCRAPFTVGPVKSPFYSPLVSSNVRREAADTSASVSESDDPCDEGTRTEPRYQGPITRSRAGRSSDSSSSSGSGYSHSSSYYYESDTNDSYATASENERPLSPQDTGATHSTQQPRNSHPSIPIIPEEDETPRPAPTPSTSQPSAQRPMDQGGTAAASSSRPKRPKLDQPVDGYNPTRCSKSSKTLGKHDWNMRGSNDNVRRYHCMACRLLVRNKGKDDQWYHLTQEYKFN